MNTRMHPSKLAALALLPLLGVGVLAWQGAHRPEKMIVGKWLVQGTGSVIEFKADGTYQALTNPGRVRQWGRYRFLDRHHLQYRPLGAQAEGKPRRLAAPGAEQNFLPEVEVKIGGERAQVFAAHRDPPALAETWKRIE